MLADWINQHGCLIQIKRLGKGFYMFGTKKIYAKIMNGKLVIRVGGGYMSIDEFMKHYGMQEMQKLQRMQLEQEEDDDLDMDDALKGAKSLNKRKTVVGVAQAKAALRKNKGRPATGIPKTSARKRAATMVNKSALNRPGTAAVDLEKQLRDMEKAAADGTLGEGMMNLDV